MRVPRHVAAAVAVALLALGACARVVDLVTPGRPDAQGPARLALALRLPRLQVAESGAQRVIIESAYERADGALVPLDSADVILADVPMQMVPLSFNLDRCLTDPARREVAGDPGACQVRLIVSLTRNGRVLDLVPVGPVRLAPGVTTTVPGTIELFEIAIVVLSAASDTAPLPPLDSIVAGSSIALRAEARDATGAVVTDRVVTWTSSNAAAATVSSAGVVSGIAPGQARITATVGGRNGAIEFVVTPPNQRLTIEGVPSSGAGRITSRPAGIDCVITTGSTSGACAIDVAFGTTVELTAEVVPESARFSGWAGACSAEGTAPSCTRVMNEPRTVAAGFIGLSAVRVVGGSAGDEVLIASDQTPGISCALGSAPLGDCAATFEIGTLVTLRAFEFGSARVRSWIGCDSATRTQCDLVVGPSPRTLTVEIDAPRQLVTFLQGTGGGVVSSSSDPTVPSGLACSRPARPGFETCTTSYPIGTLVDLTATPDPGSRFARWIGGPCDGSTLNSCTVELVADSAVQLGVEFTLAQAPDASGAR